MITVLGWFAVGLLIGAIVSGVTWAVGLDLQRRRYERHARALDRISAEDTRDVPPDRFAAEVRERWNRESRSER